jgi:hypothetical protein
MLFIFGIEEFNRHGSVVGDDELSSSRNMVPSHGLPKTQLSFSLKRHVDFN